MTKIRALALVLLASAAPAAAEVLVEARYWPTELSGRLELENLSNNEFFSDLDPINDLGLEEDGATEGRVVFYPGAGFAVRLAWLPLSFVGDEKVSGMIGPLPVTPRVRSTLDLDYGRLGLAWQFLATRDGRFRLGPMIEAKGFQGDATVAVDNPIVPLVETTQFETALASAGLMLDAEPSPRVHLFAEWTTLVDTSEGDLRDSEVGVRILVFRNLGLTVGYRKIEIDVQDGLDLLEVDIDAAFAGLSVRF